FDGGITRNEIPSRFVWPESDLPSLLDPLADLPVPCIDLAGFVSGDPVETERACRLVGEACREHGFFLVANHGIDAGLVRRAHICADRFFGLPFREKERASKKAGEVCGYSSGFVGRFDSKLPWKETLSFHYEDSAARIVEDYFDTTLGPDFGYFMKVLQEYCREMSSLSVVIMEMLALSLGLKRRRFSEFFEGNESIMRLNYYPQCRRPDQTLGTGPHCDPTSLTILHQDSVHGLQVFVDGRWRSVNPTFDSFVVNIGDTFM
ncbi:gibberellin 20-oxidase, partial [Genlisea aurea]